MNFYENDILEVCNINKLDYINQIKPIQVKKIRIFSKNNDNKKELDNILKEFKNIYYS